MTTTPDRAAAQVTKSTVRKHDGMPNWCFLGIGRDATGKMRAYWPYTSDIDGQRFLTRFIVFRTPYASVDVTRVGMADDAREWPHDHSRTFRSFKFGWYSEWVYRNPDDLTDREHRRHRRFSMHTLRHYEAHSITEVSPHLVTVLFLGRQKRKSNYWTPAGFQTIGMAVDQDGAPDQDVWG